MHMAGVFQGKGLLLTKRRSHYYESHGFHTSSLEKSLEAVDNSVSWMLQVTWNVLSDYTVMKLFVVSSSSSSSLFVWLSASVRLA